MPLPFMKFRKEPGISLAVRSSGSSEMEPSDGQEQEDQGLLAAAEDLLRAFDQKDPQHLALALRAAFDILDSESHEEGPHINEYEQEEQE